MREQLRPDDANVARVVARLHEHAADAEGWDKAVHVIGDVLRGRVLCIHRYHIGTRLGEAVRVLRGLTSEDAEEYRQHHAPHNVWMGRLRGVPRPGDVLVSHRICPESELVRHRFYQDFLKPNGVFAMLAVVLESTDREFETVNILRGRRLGHYTDDEELLVQRLVPHLQTLHRMHRLYSAERARSRLLAEVLDRIPTAVFALAPDLRIADCNRAAEKLLAVGDGVGVDHGRLTVSDRAARHALRSMVENLGGTRHGSIGSAGTSFRIGRPSFARPFAASVTAVRSLVAGDAARGAGCLLFVENLDEVHLPTAERLMGLWELTRCEARVARLLAAGLSPREIANELEVSFNTVRSHIQRTLEKTGANRQSEIVYLVTRLGMTTHDSSD